MKHIYANQKNFWFLILTADWDFMLMFGGLCSILSFFGVGLIDESSSFLQRFLIAVCLVLIVFVIKLIRQCNKLYLGYFVPLKAVRKIKGEGVYKGTDILVFTTSLVLQRGTLVTLYCSSSGAKQPLCLLKIISSDPDETLAIQENGPKNITIDKYFNEESRREHLFAIPIVNFEISL